MLPPTMNLYRLTLLNFSVSSRLWHTRTLPLNLTKLTLMIDRTETQHLSSSRG